MLLLLGVAVLLPPCGRAGLASSCQGVMCFGMSMNGRTLTCVVNMLQHACREASGPCGTATSNTHLHPVQLPACLSPVRASIVRRRPVGMRQFHRLLQLADLHLVS